MNRILTQWRHTINPVKQLAGIQMPQVPKMPQMAIDLLGKNKRAPKRVISF